MFLSFLFLYFLFLSFPFLSFVSSTFERKLNKITFCSCESSWGTLVVWTSTQTVFRAMWVTFPAAVTVINVGNRFSSSLSVSSRCPPEPKSSLIEVFPVLAAHFLSTSSDRRYKTSLYSVLWLNLRCLLWFVSSPRHLSSFPLVAGSSEECEWRRYLISFSLRWEELHCCSFIVGKHLSVVINFWPDRVTFAL